MGYTDQTLVTGYLNRNLTEREATIIKTVIDSVTDYINNETGDTWETTATGVARYFTGGEPLLIIDSCLNIESVQHVDADGNILYDYEATEYNAYPLNRTTKTQLEHFPRWPKGTGQIKVTGKWGQSDGVPSDIQLAATILASAVFQNETDNIKSESIEGYSVTYSDVKQTNSQVRDILDAHRVVRL